MKFRIIYLSLVLVLLQIACKRKTSQYQYPQRFYLSKVWKFKLGDSLDYSKPEFNDSHWDTISSGADWESQGFKDYYGYAWYRTKVNIPLSIKNTFAKDSLKINLGCINDNDQVYINGYFLGENNKMLPYPTPDTTFTRKDLAWPNFREYVISSTDKRLKWGKENVIAIRVSNTSDKGGLFFGDPYIAMKGINDYIEFDTTKFFKIDDENTLSNVLVLRNTSNSLTFNGDFSLNAKSKQNTGEGSYEKKNIILRPLDSLAIPITLPYSTEPVSVSLLFRETKFSMEVKDVVIVPFVLTK